MNLPTDHRAYIKELDTCIQSGHECGPGRWWHVVSMNKSEVEIGRCVDRLFAHLEVCPGVPEAVRAHLVMLRNRRDHG